jgi:hypothetical protein
VKIYRGRLRLRFFSLAIASGYDFGDVIMGFHDYITQHVHVVALLTTFQSSPLFFTKKKKRKTDGKLCSVPYPLHLKYHRCTEDQQWRRLVADKSKCDLGNKILEEWCLDLIFYSFCCLTYCIDFIKKTLKVNGYLFISKIILLLIL